MAKQYWLEWFQKLKTMILGSVFLGVGVNAFLVPHRLLDGGMIGLGLIVHYISGIATGLAVIILSLPIFLIAYINFRAYFLYGVIGMLISSFSIDLLAPMYRFNLFSIGISSILGGIFVGIGIGMMLKQGISTGGMDLLALLLAKIIHINVGLIIFIFDFAIVVLGSYLLGSSRFHYTFLTIAIVFLSTTFVTKINN